MNDFNNKLKSQVSKFVGFRLLMILNYGALSCLVPYLPVLLSSESMNPWQIGILNSLRPLTTAISSPLSTMLLDYQGERTNVKRGIVFAYAIVNSLLLVLLALLPSPSFFVMILILFPHFFFATPIIPILDGLIFASLTDETTRDACYGKIRMCASSSWGAFAMISGALAWLWQTQLDSDSPWVVGLVLYVILETLFAFCFLIAPIPLNSLKKIPSTHSLPSALASEQETSDYHLLSSHISDEQPTTSKVSTPAVDLNDSPSSSSSSSSSPSSSSSSSSSSPPPSLQDRDLVSEPEEDDTDFHVSKSSSLDYESNERMFFHEASNGHELPSDSRISITDDSSLPPDFSTHAHPDPSDEMQDLFNPTPSDQESFGNRLWFFVRQCLSSIEFCWFLVVSLILGCAHTFILVGLFLFLQSLNANGILLGLATVCSIGTEIPYFWFSGTLLRKFGPELNLLVSMIAYVVRVGGYYFITNPWFALPFQMLHGLSFGAFWASALALVNNKAPHSIRASAQGIFFSIYSGIGAVIGAIGGGFIYQLWGPGMLWLIGCALALLCIFSWFIVEKKLWYPKFLSLFS